MRNQGKGTYSPDKYRRNVTKIRAAHKRYRDTHKAHINEQQRIAHRLDPRYRMLKAAQRRAKLAALPFQLVLGDIVVPETCPALGIKLEVGGQSGGPASPSLDRIKPELGYIPSNVIVISKRANLIKNNATADELRKVADFFGSLSC